VSGFGPPPGAPAEDVRRRPPAYLPPGGLATASSGGMPVTAPDAVETPPGGLAAPGSAEAAAPSAAAHYRGGGVVRGPDRVLLVTSHKPGIISLRPMSLGDIVDADLVEAVRGEQVDGHIADVVPRRGAPPANPVLGIRRHEPHPSISALDAILLRPRSHCRDSTRRKVLFMEPNQEVGTEAGAAAAATSGSELVTETLVEEVSIDGMCGVY